MDYSTRLDEENQAHVNYKCPCGCDAGLIYSRDKGTTEAGECCCGRILWVGGDAEAEVRRRQEDTVDYRLDVTIVTLPWGESVEAVLAVPASTLEEERSQTADGQPHDHAHDHGHDHGHDHEQEATTEKVVDVVCGMTIDPRNAAGQSEYSGKKYYFCAASCKAKFDAEPTRYVKTSLADTIKQRFLGG